MFWQKTIFRCRRSALAFSAVIFILAVRQRLRALPDCLFTQRKMSSLLLQNKIPVNPWFRVDPDFWRRYNKNKYENLEVNAGKWTRIIVEVEPPARWIRKQKQLRFPQLFASFAEPCGKAPFQRCRFPQNRAEEGAALCAQNAAFAAFRQARRRVFCFPICCVLRIQELLLCRKN